MPLESMLETVQKDRATGTLHMNGSKGSATLYFLFGHLFHAVDAERQGEPVVYDVLDWRDGDFTFDSKAKLPAEETIKISTAELLARRAEGAAAAPPEPESEAEAASEAAAKQVLAEAEQIGIVEPAEDEPAPAADVAPAEVEAAAEPEAVAPPAPEPVAPAPAVPDGSSFPRRRSTDVRPGTRPPETMELYPVPMGELIYQSLTAAFVDFPKLLRSLAKDQHSGYVRLSGDDFTCILLFSSGAVVEAIYDGRGEVLTGVNAFKKFGEDIDNSEGNLDVVRLTTELVTALFQLLTAASLYDRLTARFIKAGELLGYLAEEGISGAAVVRLEGQCGVVLYRSGTILGSYTDTAPAVEADPAAILALCEDPRAQIEVRGGQLPETLPVLDSSPAQPATVSAGPSPTVAPPAPEAPVEAGGPASGAVAVDEPSGASPAAEPDSHSSIPAATVTASASGGSVGSNGAGADEPDWATLISAMAGRADAVLGTRSKKVKELLYSAGHNREDVESTIDRISELSIMFVDPYKLTALAADMRQIAAGTA